MRYFPDKEGKITSEGLDMSENLVHFWRFKYVGRDKKRG